MQRTDIYKNGSQGGLFKYAIYIFGILVIGISIYVYLGSIDQPEYAIRVYYSIMSLFIFGIFYFRFNIEVDGELNNLFFLAGIGIIGVIVLNIIDFLFGFLFGIAYLLFFVSKLMENQNLLYTNSKK